jgi:hypothetical protein
MLLRAGLIWFGIVIVAILNGAFRDLALAPRLGDTPARALSCLTLAGAIMLATWISLPWIHPISTTDAWRIGVIWLAMTLAFEFLAGHYLFHAPWASLLADYNLFRGRLWIIVLIATVAAPALVFRAEHNPARGEKISSPTTDDTTRE